MKVLTVLHTIWIAATAKGANSSARFFFVMCFFVFISNLWFSAADYIFELISPRVVLYGYFRWVPILILQCLYLYGLSDKPNLKDLLLSSEKNGQDLAISVVWMLLGWGGISMFAERRFFSWIWFNENRGKIELFDFYETDLLSPSVGVELWFTWGLCILLHGYLNRGQKEN